MSGSPHVGIVTSSYPAHDGDIAFPFAPPFARGLVDGGVRVTVLTPARRGIAYADDPVPVRTFAWLGGRKPLVRLKPYLPWDLAAIVSVLVAGERALVALHDRDPLDYCLALTAVPAGYLAWRLRRRRGVPYGVWALGSDVNVWGRYPIARSLLHAILARAEHRFADGLELCETVRGLGGLSCDFLPTGRPIEAAPRLPDLPPADPRLLFVGRLERVKGIDVLIEAMARLVDRCPTARLEVVGAGSLDASLRGRTRQLGLTDQVGFHGAADAATVAGFLAAADCVVIPSRSESIPLVLVEALAAARPLVVTDVGDMGPLAHEMGLGNPVPPGDATALAAALARFAALTPPERAARRPDPGLAARFDVRRSAVALLERLGIGTDTGRPTRDASVADV